MQGELGKLQLRIWLAVVGTAALVLVAAYTMVQQSTRLEADDLPLATAQTVQHELETGAAPADTVPLIKTNLRDDSTVFVIVTDSTQHVLASSANLDWQTPLPPSGVFSYTKQHATDHFTWEPTSGVRLATRVLTYADGSTSNGFVIAGQSLSQPENRVNTYNILALGAFLAILAWTTLLILLSPARKFGSITTSPKKKSGSSKN